MDEDPGILLQLMQSMLLGIASRKLGLRIWLFFKWLQGWLVTYAAFPGYQTAVSVRMVDLQPALERVQRADLHDHRNQNKRKEYQRGNRPRFQIKEIADGAKWK